MSSTIANWRASHVPGLWPVLMGPSTLVAVGPSISADLTALWEKVLQSASMADLVTVLAAIGPAQSPDLVALFWSDQGMRSLVRGSVQLLDPTTAEVLADGSGVLTWREVGLSDRELIEIDLGAGPVGTRGLPLVVGAVRAGAVRLEAGAAASVISAQALTVEQPSSTEAMGGSPPVASDFPESSDVDPESPLPGGLTRRTSPPSPPDPDPARIEMENADTELMGSPEPQSSAEQPATFEGDVDQPHESSRPLVQAAICLSGHANPPHASECGLCGAPVPPQTTQLVPRPVLGVLRSPDGVAIDIAGPVLLGRAPVPRDDLSEAPELMRVPSPGQDISRTHLLVSPDDWEIRLTDLHSTNGTNIVRPGPGVERLRLQPGEPHAVDVGTVIELGDGVAVLVDGPPRPAS
ncbi:MAG: FHA domain-containing protein [Microlunatus sp.]|nr:FHA domain-containing protein [Microlunatus sp.]